MAFFKLRKGGDEQTAVVAPSESIEALRKRAKHRLIGSVVLVLVAVVGFPLLVDKQPRPMAVDIAIDIPDKGKVKPLTVPASADTPAPAATQAPAPGPVAVVSPVPPAPPAKAAVKPAPAPVAASAVAPVAAKLVNKAPEKAADKASTKPVDQSTEKTTEKSADKSTDRVVDKPKVTSDKADKAEAKTAVAEEDRYVVQVGAFADEGRARASRQKLERAGFKNYTQVAETKDGKRTRVRAGPYATKADADKAAEKIKKLGLPTSVLTL